MADTAAGRGLSDRLSGRAGGEDAQRGRVENRAVYVAIGITLEGRRKCWACGHRPTKGAKFWLQVLTELKNRGVEDIFIACVDGLKGFPAGHRDGLSEDHGAAVHRAHGAGQPELRELEGAQAGGADLKSIYRAATVEEAERQLAAVRRASGTGKYPSIGALWRRNWQGVIPFFQFPPEIRKIVYTTNAIESAEHESAQSHQDARLVSLGRSGHESDVPGAKKSGQEMARRQGWNEALNRFALLWEARFPQQCD